MMVDEIISVALPVPLMQGFDYRVPKGISVVVGARVKVPFGRRSLVGVVLGCLAKSTYPYEKLKSISDVLDEAPLFSDHLLRLLRWASEYYHAPIGEVVFAALPAHLRKGKSVPAGKEADEGAPCLKETPPALSDEQKVVVDAICEASAGKTFLLEGVTGSGKTEVYMRAIERTLKQGAQALVLVPEISLTPQMVQRFRDRFDAVIAVVHSGVTDVQRLRAWERARRGCAQIIIGTRSAIFTPMKHPGLIVVDEEHDASFKQQSGFRYSARDLAVYRGKVEGVPVVLGSATPSFRALHNAARGLYEKLMLTRRAGGASPPSLHLVDMRNQQLVHGVSSQLIQATKKHLDSGGQVLFFLNRRGYAPVLLCHHCGWQAQCEHCDVKLVLHQSPKSLRCHHCCGVFVVPDQCPACEKNALISVGSGTQRLEDYLQECFPSETITRIDRDMTKKKGAMEEKLDAVASGRSGLLVGTQMVAKGHHFPNLTMVAVVDADWGLYSADCYAGETMMQLLLQVAGRSGREEKKGDVYVQTHNPHHPYFSALFEKGYAGFVALAMRDREQAMLPPFSHVAVLRADAASSEKVMRFLNGLVDRIKQSKSSQVDCVGPMAMPIYRKAKRYYAQLVLRSESREHLHALLRQTQRLLRDDASGKGVAWCVDVDPTSLF